MNFFIRNTAMFCPFAFEEWRPIEGYEGSYEISSLGRVRSIRVWTNGLKPKVKKPNTHRLGYKFIFLSKDAKPKNYYVHRLVAAAFIGPANGREVNHKNGDKTDNRVWNLEYTDRSGNMRHAAITMGVNRGEKSGRAKLTAEKVREIRSLAKTVGPSAIAERFGIASGTVSNIVAGRRWWYLD